jgi:hypothetical protein
MNDLFFCHLEFAESAEPTGVKHLRKKIPDATKIDFHILEFLYLLPFFLETLYLSFILFYKTEIEADIQLFCIFVLSNILSTA